MVKQGEIIKVNFNPQVGHEQKGYRPAVVVSNNFFNEVTKLVLACPITHTTKNFPLHIPLDDRTTTQGVILCEHIKALDLCAREYIVVESLPKEILEEVVEVVFGEIEII